MKILRLCPYYEPEQISSSYLTKDLEEAYVNAGFEIEIYVPTPTRSISKEVRKQYKKIKYEEKFNGKIKVYRFSMFREGKNPVYRAIRYLLCNTIHYFKGIHAKDINLIIAGSTPPTQGMIAAFVKKRLNVPMVYRLSDVFPDSLVNTGLAKYGSLLWRIGRIIEDFTYKNADKIVVVSNDIKQNIISKGVPLKKIEVVHDWTDENAIKNITRDKNTLFDELHLDRNLFYITYAGNLGNSQGVETILGAADLLKDKTDIRFIIFGNGLKENELKQLASVKQLNNISFYPLQPQGRISEVYSLGDASIVICKYGVGKTGMPSKTWSIMSAGTAVLASFDYNTELQYIIENYNTGLFSKADDFSKLADNIFTLYSNRELCKNYGQNGRKYIEEQLTKTKCTKQMIDIISSCYKQYGENL